MNRILQQLRNLEIIPLVERLLWWSLMIFVIHVVFILLLGISQQKWTIETARLPVDEIQWHLDRRGVRYDDNASRDKLLEQLRTSGDSIRLADEYTVHCKSPEDCQDHFIHEGRRVWIIKVGKKGCLTDVKKVLKKSSLNSWEYVVAEARRVGLRTATLTCPTDNVQGLCWFIRNVRSQFCRLLIATNKTVHPESEGMGYYPTIYIQYLYSTISLIDQVDINKHFTTSDTYTVTMFARARRPPLFYRLLSIAYKDKIRFMYFNTNTEKGQRERKLYTTSELDPLYFVQTPHGNYSYGGGRGEYSTFGAVCFFLDVNIVISTVQDELALDMHQTYTETFYLISLYVKSSWIGTLSRYLWFQYVSYNKFKFWVSYLTYVCTIFAVYHYNIVIDQTKQMIEISLKKILKRLVPEESERTRNGEVQTNTRYVDGTLVSPPGAAMNVRIRYTEEERVLMLQRFMSLLEALPAEPQVDIDEVMSCLETWYHPYESSEVLDYLFNCHEQFLNSTFCTICTESYIEEEVICGLNCGHTFHRNCIYYWFKQNRDTCPNCRKQQTWD